MKFIEHGPQLYSVQLNENLVDLQQSCALAKQIILGRYAAADRANNPNDLEALEALSTSSLTTKYFGQYNLLLFPMNGFHELYHSIKQIFNELVEEKNSTFYLQCWLNYYNKNQFIGWHSHWPPEKNAWHGFFCVNVEPDSRTSYRWLDKNLYVDVESKNNLLVIGKSNGDQHRSSKWEHDEPRITIAFDILPKENIADVPLNKMILPSLNGYDFFNHWIPI